MMQRSLLEKQSRILVLEAVPRISTMNLRVTSGSMRPLIRHGDVLQMQKLKSWDLQCGEIVLVDKKGLALVHRIIALRSGAIKIRGDSNPKCDGWFAAEQVLARCIAINGHRIDTPAWRFVNRQIARISPYSHQLRAPLRLAGRLRRYLGLDWL